MTKKLTLKQVQSRFAKVHSDLDCKIVCFKTTHEPVSLRCLKNKNHTWTSQYYDILKPGYKGCPYCSGYIVNNEVFQRKLDERFGKGMFTLKSDYTEMRENVTVEHANCHMEETLKAAQLYEYGSCVNCDTMTTTTGETILADMFSENGLSYIPQYTIWPEGYINSHGDTGWLKVDFYLPDFNLFVEFDSPQHYNKSENRYSEDGVKRDRIKDNYALKHHIRMLRIRSYKPTEMAKSLEKYLPKLSLPSKIRYHNRYLPIYEIYKYVQGHTYKETKANYAKYNLGDMRIKSIIKMYRGTSLAVKQYGEKRKSPIRNEQDFKTALHNLWGDRFVLLSNYIDSKTPVHVLDTSNNIDFHPWPSGILHPKNGNNYHHIAKKSVK